MRHTMALAACAAFGWLVVTGCSSEGTHTGASADATDAAQTIDAIATEDAEVTDATDAVGPEGVGTEPETDVADLVDSAPQFETETETEFEFETESEFETETETEIETDTEPPDASPCPTDRDGDGSPDCLDCAPDDPSRYPGAFERCDGVPNDCLAPADWTLADEDGVVTRYVRADFTGAAEDVTAVFAAGTAAAPVTVTATGSLRFCDGHYFTHIAGTNFLLRSLHGRDVTTLDGGGAGGAVVHVLWESPTTTDFLFSTGALDGFTVTGGDDAGVRIDEATFALGAAYLEVVNCLVRGNTGTRGGGIQGGNVICTSSIVEHNSSSGGGGGIAGAHVMLTDCIIRNNHAALEGGGVVAGLLEMKRGAVSQNSAATDGGGLVVAGAASTITDVTIDHNTAAARGGGLTLRATLTLSTSTVAFNDADDGGGFLVDFGPTGFEDTSFHAGTVRLNDTLVTDNTATRGAGAFLTGGIPCPGCNPKAGASIVCSASPAAPSGFLRNAASVSAGAVYLDTYAFMSSVGCTFGSAADDDTPEDLVCASGATFEFGDDATFACTDQSCE